jgi:hypothetical protein
MTILDHCLLNLGSFFLFYFILEECQMCVHYLEYIILTPIINNWYTCKHYYSSSYPY